MTDLQIEYSKVKNPENKDCPICAELNGIYQANYCEKVMQLPKDIGEGYCRRIAVKPSMEISIIDMNFFDGITINGTDEHIKSFYDLSFCLEGNFSWRTTTGKNEFEAQSGSNFMLRGKDAYGISDIDGGQHFSYLNIRMSEDYIADVFKQACIEQISIPSLCHPSHFRKSRTSFNMKRILYEIMNCRLSQSVKRIYLEAKIIELLAVYLDEIIFENKVMLSSSSIFREDIASLQKAKSILDADIANTPSLGQLARLVCLNEYKLKTGFKELFGLSVHAYIIDRRLEKARYLLESGTYRVSEAAQFVGYNELGRFAEKFRKKFGMNPSEFIRSS